MRRHLMAGLLAAALAIPSAALADEGSAGTTLTAGPGVDVFTSEEMLDYSDAGPAWGARLAVRTRRLLGLEIGYTGMARDVSVLGGDPDSRLVGHGAEALARLQIGNPDGIQSYLLAGAGWRRYELSGVAASTSNVAGGVDDVMEVPLGIGLMARFGHLVVDVRTTYRHALDDELVAAPTGSDIDPDLNHVEGSFALGAEF